MNGNEEVEMEGSSVYHLSMLRTHPNSGASNAHTAPGTKGAPAMDSRTGGGASLATLNTAQNTLLSLLTPSVHIGTAPNSRPAPIGLAVCQQPTTALRPRVACIHWYRLLWLVGAIPPQVRGNESPLIYSKNGLNTFTASLALRPALYPPINTMAGIHKYQAAFFATGTAIDAAVPTATAAMPTEVMNVSLSIAPTHDTKDCLAQIAVVLCCVCCRF